MENGGVGESNKMQRRYGRDIFFIFRKKESRVKFEAERSDQHLHLKLVITKVIVVRSHLAIT